MDIVARNLFRLLRNGAFGTQELMEPMSAYKWERLYQLALVHRVVNYAYQGLQNSRDQFFVNLPEKQKEAWLKAVGDTSKQMPAMDEHSDTNTRQMLLMIIRVVRHILNEGMPICQLLELGIFMRQQGTQVDYNALKGWISKLRLAPMSQLEGELLILLFGFQPEDVPFCSEKQDKKVAQIAEELLDFTNTRSHDWYFSQDDDSIFVHNSNSSAMFSHVRRSARYFRYYPSESVTNFFASFVHSLSHIEE